MAAKPRGRPFQPGQSGNPDGRRAEATPEFREACRKRIPNVLRVLDAALRVPSRQLKACEIILNYAIGKPVQLIAGSADFPPIGVDLNETVPIYIPDNHRDPGKIPAEMLVDAPEPDAKPEVEAEERPIWKRQVF